MAAAQVDREDRLAAGKADGFSPPMVALVDIPAESALAALAAVVVSLVIAHVRLPRERANDLPLVCAASCEIIQVMVVGGQ